MKLKITDKNRDQDWKFCKVFIPTLIGSKSEINYFKNRLIIVAR